MKNKIEQHESPQSNPLAVESNASKQRSCSIPKMVCDVMTPELRNATPSGPLDRELRERGEFGELIFVYTRAEAIADGVLIDVSQLAREAGFRVPVAMTATAWEACVRVPETATGQDETGRLWDVLNALAFVARAAGGDQREIRFTVVVRESDELIVNVPLKALCGPGDNAEPVITILLPYED